MSSDPSPGSNIKRQRKRKPEEGTTVTLCMADFLTTHGIDVRVCKDNESIILTGPHGLKVFQLSTFRLHIKEDTSNATIGRTPKCLYFQESVPYAGGGHTLRDVIIYSEKATSFPCSSVANLISNAIAAGLAKK